MLAILKRYWFLLSLGVAVGSGYIWPAAGQFLIRYEVLTVGLVVSFLLTGLTLESRVIVDALGSVKALTAATVSSLVIYPLIAWLLASALPYPELVVGCCILATAPATISSGTILTALARGNVAFSVLICIATHFISVFSIPLLLNLFLGAGVGVELPVIAILSGLVLKVLVPIIIGQLLRPHVGRYTKRFSSAISVFQSLLILFMVMTAVASSADRLNLMAGFLLIVAALVGALHICMILLNYLLARALRLDYETLVAFTIHAPQKTLAVSFLVWSGAFAAQFPGALVPAIVCHLLQMISGTLIAQHFSKRGPGRLGGTGQT